MLRLPTRRELRLGSGLVMLGYMALHMFNHALGLISLDAAERVLAIAVRAWHSVAGSGLLYGAAAIHIALAFHMLYERPSFRLPAIEVVRIVAGFSIPVLLLNHFTSTRVAFELYDAAPRYSRIVGAIWASNGEARQLALLAPGWVHGCLGIHLAFGHRRWYSQWRPLLFMVAVLLPLLAGAGFIAMTLDVAERGVVPQPGISRETLEKLRYLLYALYAVLLLAVVGARRLRPRKGNA